ncbi:MAG: hypothetical protein U1F49_01895 [Rubrivivax sp.]
MAGHFAYLKSLTDKVPGAMAKMTIPSPSMLHLRGGRAAISRSAYPDLDAFWDDVAAAYRQAIAHLGAAGCRYLQLDDVAFAYLCDPKVQATCRANGDDPAALPRTYARGHQRGAGRQAGGHARHDPHLPRQLQERLGRRRRLRAGGGRDVLDQRRRLVHGVRQHARRRLRAVGAVGGGRRRCRGQRKVVLGLVTTKFGALESKDDLKRRIDEAARFVPERPACRVIKSSSTHHGNALSHEDQWRKLVRVVEVARETWGDGQGNEAACRWRRALVGLL